MKLFTPTQAQSQVRSQTVLQASRDKELSDAISEKRAELARLEGDFQSLLASQRERWALEERQHAEETERMEELVEKKLRERYKVKALAPTEDLRKNAEESIIQELEEARRALESAHKRETESEILEEKLIEKLDTVGEREEKVIEREASVSRRIKGIELQEEATKANARHVSDGLERLRQDVERAEKTIKNGNDHLNTRTLDLHKKEQELHQKEKVLEERERIIIIKEYMFNSPVKKL